MSEVYTIALSGCTPVPLGGYLKSLGILRLVAQQADPKVRGYWDGGTFNLQSSLRAEDLCLFFNEQYRPTPIIAPWNGGSGFYSSDNRTAVDEIVRASSHRLETYRETILNTRSLLERFDLYEKPKDDAKMQLLIACRNELSDGVVEWIDAVAMLSRDDPKFPPLLGTGGNDGRLEFTNNFMKNVTQLIDVASGHPKPQSADWLQAALFATPTPGMVKSAIGQFSPGQAGGPNATTGFSAESLINPWDFVLTLEGAIVFAAAASRKHENTRLALLSYPFTVLPAGVGNGSTSEVDEDTTKTRAEMWLPLWTQPTSYAEVAHLFREGRVQVRRSGRKNRRSYRLAADGVDFARACASLAVDRGIHSFQRYAFVKRAGKSYLAVPLTRFRVRREASADLLADLEDWVGELQRFCDANETPVSFKRALRVIKNSMFELAEFGGRHRVRRLLTQLAQIEQLCVHSPKARASIRPLVLTNTSWLHEAADGSDEWDIAIALSSLQAASGATCWRAYLSPVDSVQPWKWSEEQNPASVVWGMGDVAASLARVLERRVLDWRRGEKEQGGEKPFGASLGVSLEQIHAFLYGSPRLKRAVGELVWALLPFTTRGNGALRSMTTLGRFAKEVHLKRSEQEKRFRLTHVPWVYAVSKLVISRNEDLMRTSSGLEDIDMPIPGGLVNLITSERLNDAASLAEQRLRGSGLIPVFQELRAFGVSGNDCAAALLIPLNMAALRGLQKGTILQPKQEENQTDSQNETL